MRDLAGVGPSFSGERPSCSCFASASFHPADRFPRRSPFRKHTLDLGRNETCAVADLNGDGRLDVISGENWYEAPSWRKHRFRRFPTLNNYIDVFSDLPLDVDRDGKTDIVSVSYMSRKMAWFRNPGRPQAEWKESVIDSGAPVEFAFLVDIDNDGNAQWKSCRSSAAGTTGRRGTKSWKKGAQLPGSSTKSI